MSSVDELCGLGFDRYWVNQALELTNHNKDYALEWLLSDEFEIARKQFDEQQAQFKAKQTDSGLALPDTKTDSGNATSGGGGGGNYNHNLKKNPLLDPHSGDTLASAPSKNNKYHNKYQMQISSQSHINHNADLALERSQSDESTSLQHLKHQNQKSANSEVYDEEQPANNNNGNKHHWPQKPKQQQSAEQWICSSCEMSVSMDLKACHLCNNPRPDGSDSESQDVNNNNHKLKNMDNGSKPKWSQHASAHSGDDPTGAPAESINNNGAAHNNNNNNVSLDVDDEDVSMQDNNNNLLNGNNNNKIKIKLRIGTKVEVYSATRNDWTEGTIQKINGDLVCIVYGKHMKWLLKNSPHLRPKLQDVEIALMQQSTPKQMPKIPPSKALPPNKPLPAFGSGNNNNNNVPLQNGNYNIDDSALLVDGDLYEPPVPDDAPSMELPSDIPAPPKPAEFGTPRIPRNKHQPNPSMIQAKPDEFDYYVTFNTRVLGMELYPDDYGKNCIVGKCLSKTAKKFVDPSSIIVAVDDMWVAGMQFEMVRDAIKQRARKPPLKIQFRVKMNNMGKKKNTGMNERGYLKVKVVAGVELRQRASYCVVQVGNARLSTREVERHEHPDWSEILTFKNFRPDQGKKAIVTLFDHSAMVKDKKIGTSSYEIPISFNKLQRDVLELKSSTGKKAGVVILNTIIVHKNNSHRHGRR